MSDRVKGTSHLEIPMSFVWCVWGHSMHSQLSREPAVTTVIVSRWNSSAPAWLCLQRTEAKHLRLVVLDPLLPRQSDVCTHGAHS